MLLPRLSNRRRSRALRLLAVAQISTNDKLADFLARGFWGRVRWFLFGL